MQQLRKLQKLIIGMGEALLCYGAEISRVEETIQRVADHYQVEEVILPLNVCRRFRKQKMNRYGSWCFLPVWVQLRLVISLAEASGIAWQRLCAV